MRSFTGTLLFEEVLDTVTPTGLIGQTLTQLFEPRVTIIQDNCFTLLGSILPVSADLIGRTRRQSNLPLTQDDISSILSSGAREVAVRSTHTCIAAGGVCRKCYMSDRPYADSPETDTQVVIPASYFLQIDHLSLRATGFCTLRYFPGQYDELYVYRNSVLVPRSGYSVNGLSLRVIGGSDGDYIIVKYWVSTRVPFMHKLSGTYGGSLLGMRGIEGRDTPLRRVLHSSLFPQGELQSLQSQITASTLIPSEIRSYAVNCKDEYERAIFLSAIAAIYLAD